MSYRVRLRERESLMSRTSNIIVVGCGGTGSFVAEGLCRLISNEEYRLLLVDHDRVEPHNLRRQNFFAGDVGKFKSQALAERLSRLYGRRVGYSVYPFDPDLLNEPMGGGFVSKMTDGVIIGCVDSAPARESISRSISWHNWWLDSGNGHDSGQVLLGNACNLEQLQEGFSEQEQTVSKLPIPSLQLPSLLVPAKEPVRRRRDCAEAVEAEEQSPTINQAMATLVLDFTYRLLEGKLTWMGAYIDLEAGTLSTVPAEPEVVARMMSMPKAKLMENACSLGNRLRIHV